MTPILVLAPESASWLSPLQRLSSVERVTLENAHRAQVVLVGMGFGANLQQVWPQLRDVRWIHSLSAGVETVLFPALQRSPVPLTNARGVFATSLAEFCLMAMLHFAKDTRRLIRNQEAGRWERFTVEELKGRTVGILGYGEIGRAVAVRAQAMGMNVMATRRHPGRDEVAKILPPEQKMEVIAASDYLVLSLPLTKETMHAVASKELQAMKPGAVLINVGRGPSVHEGDLWTALKERKIRGAALDVFEVEPLPAGHPFYSLDNLLLSPHCADQTATWLDESMGVFLNNLERFQRGENLLNVVDKALGY